MQSPLYPKPQGYCLQKDVLQLRFGQQGQILLSIQRLLPLKLPISYNLIASKGV